MEQATHNDTTPGADAEILRLAAQFHDAEARFRARLASPTYSDAATSEAALLVRRKRCCALRLAETIATTEEGRLAKARVLLAVAHRDLAGDFTWETAAEWLGVSLARDLVGPFGRGAGEAP